MSAQPDPVVAVELAPYRQPAPVPPDPPPPPPAPPPPSLDHLFDEGFVICRRWLWTLGLALTLLLCAGLVGGVFFGLVTEKNGWVGPLAFAALLVPLALFQLFRTPRSIYAEPAGLRIVWGNGEAGFYPWRRVRPWTPWHALFGRWVIDIQGGPYDPPIAPYPYLRVYRLGKLLASAHAAESAASEPAPARHDQSAPHGTV